MERFLGPDGKPCVFEEGAWFTQDRLLRWNGMVWQPVKPRRYTPRWVTLGLRIGFLLVVLYAFGSSVASLSPTAQFTTGYYLGVMALLVVLVVVFRYAGRWGYLGIGLQILCAAWFLLRVIALIANHPVG